MQLCSDALKAGGTLQTAADKTGMSLGGIGKWLQKYHPTLRAALAANGRKQRKPKLSREQYKIRLMLVVKHGVNRAAKKLGISQQALSQWTHTVAPKGAALALLDYIVENEYPALK